MAARAIRSRVEPGCGAQAAQAINVAVGCLIRSSVVGRLAMPWRVLTPRALVPVRFSLRGQKQQDQTSELFGERLLADMWGSWVM